MLLALLLIVSVGAFMVLERNKELFVLSFRGGQMRLVRGAVPARLRQELTVVLRELQVNEATLRVTTRVHSARLTAEGVDERALLALRNVLQGHSVQSLLDVREAPSKNRLLRVFGVSELVWLFGTADD